MVTVLPREESVREAAILQVKLVCAACRQRGTLGVYANGTVYQPEFYLNASQPWRTGSCPCWIWCGWASTAGKRACAATLTALRPSARRR